MNFVSDFATILDLVKQIVTAIDTAKKEHKRSKETRLLVDSLGNALQETSTEYSKPSVKLAVDAVKFALEDLLRHIQYKEKDVKFWSIAKSSGRNFLGGSSNLDEAIDRLERAKSHYSWVIELRSTLPAAENDSLLNGEAEDFWAKNLGSDPRCAVDISVFLEALGKHCGNLNLTSVSWSGALKKTLDWDGNDQVSAIEFKRFLSFFGPLSQCVTLFEDAVTHGWFKPSLTGEEGQKLIMSHLQHPGFFFFRRSSSGFYGLTLQYITSDGKPEKLIVQETVPPISIGVRFHDEGSPKYQNLHELLVMNDGLFSITFPKPGGPPSPVKMPQSSYAKQLEADLASRGYHKMEDLVKQARK